MRSHRRWGTLTIEGVTSCRPSGMEETSAGLPPPRLEVIISANSARLGSNGISGSENPFLLRLTRMRAASRSAGALSRDPAGRNTQIKEDKKDVAVDLR